MRHSEDVLFGWFFPKQFLLSVKSVLLLEALMILSPRLVEQFHSRFDVVLNLQFFLLKVLFEQFGAIFDEQVSVQQVRLTAMSNFYDL